MSNRLKRLSVRLAKLLDRKSDQAETARSNQNARDPGNHPYVDSSFLHASSRATPAEEAQSLREQSDVSEPETGESELYDLDSEPHGLFILYPKQVRADSRLDVEVE